MSWFRVDNHAETRNGVGREAGLTRDPSLPRNFLLSTQFRITPFMGRLKKLRILLGILKDRASLIKATLSIKREARSTSVAVLRATTYDWNSPPSERNVASILALGDGSRLMAWLCIEAIMDRLHNSQSASVAIKCLFTLHNIIRRGSPLLKDQLSFYPSAGGRNFLNMSTFRDDSDVDMWEMSSWVRWYAGFLEQNLMVSKVLGQYLCTPPSTKKSKDEGDKLLNLPSSDLSRQIDVLVDFAEQICEAPNSLGLQRNNLVYEVLRMVIEDFRLVQSKIFLRVVEVGNRMENLSSDELIHLLNTIKRFEDCKERLLLLFVNRTKNDGLWDLISQTKMKLVSTIDQREKTRLVVAGMGKRDDAIVDSTRFRNPFADSGQMFRIVTVGGAWVGLDQVPLQLSAVG